MLSCPLTDVAAGHGLAEESAVAGLGGAATCASQDRSSKERGGNRKLIILHYIAFVLTVSALTDLSVTLRFR